MVLKTDIGGCQKHSGTAISDQLQRMPENIPLDSIQFSLTVKNPLL